MGIQAFSCYGASAFANFTVTVAQEPGVPQGLFGVSSSTNTFASLLQVNWQASKIASPIDDVLFYELQYKASSENSFTSLTTGAARYSCFNINLKI